MNCNVKFLIQSIKWHTYAVDAWLLLRLITMCCENELCKVKYCMHTDTHNEKKRKQIVQRDEHCNKLMTTSVIQNICIAFKTTQNKD